MSKNRRGAQRPQNVQPGEDVAEEVVAAAEGAAELAAQELADLSNDDEPATAEDEPAGDAGVEALAPDISLPSDVEDEDLDSEDSLTFSNGVIEKIVALAMRDVPGVIGMKGSWFNRVQDAFGASDSRKGVTVEVTPDAAVRVNVSVLIEYGAYAPQVFEDVKRAVVKQVSGMTGLSVAGVNLRIEDVLTPEEYAAGRSRAEAELPEAALPEAEE